MRQKGRGNTKVVPPPKNNEIGQISRFVNNYFEITIPMETVSESNGGRKKAIIRQGKKVYKSEHWRDAHKRHTKQKGMVQLMLNPHRHKFTLPCHVIVTRFAPRKLDGFENLPMSLKWIVDAVCATLTGDYRPGRADSDDRITIECRQLQSSEYGVGIRLEFH